MNTLTQVYKEINSGARIVWLYQATGSKNPEVGIVFPGCPRVTYQVTPEQYGQIVDTLMIDENWDMAHLLGCHGWKAKPAPKGDLARGWKATPAERRPMSVLETALQQAIWDDLHPAEDYGLEAVA